MKNPLQFKINVVHARRLVTAAVALTLSSVLFIAPACMKSSGGGNDGPIIDVMGIGRMIDSHEKNYPVDPLQEYAIGRTVAANMIDRYGAYTEANAVRYVNLVGNVFVYGLNDTPLPYAGYHFIILNTNEPIALAAPGAYIMVSKGLIKACNSEDELAAVLGHEVAHVREGHAVDVIETQRASKAWLATADTAAQLLGAAGGMAGSAEAGYAATSLGLLVNSYENVFEGIFTSGYDKQLEYEADAESIAMMKRVGYDASAFLSILDRIDDNNNQWSKSHPTTKSRLDRAKKLIGTYKGSNMNRRTARFNAIKASIK